MRLSGVLWWRGSVVGVMLRVGSVARWWLAIAFGGRVFFALCL